MNLPEAWIEEKPGIFRSGIHPTTVGSDSIDFLKGRLPSSPLGRVRFCAHSSDSDALHEMVIAMGRDTYIRPHRHLTKTESYHLVEGEMDVIIFDDRGEIRQVVAMGSAGAGRIVFYRLSISAFHSMAIRTPTVVFQETTNGPFRKEETLYAPWAPMDTDIARVKEFQRYMAREIARQPEIVGQGHETAGVLR
jgi:cupin fold WbuC family metalloprotein